MELDPASSVSSSLNTLAHVRRWSSDSPDRRWSTLMLRREKEGLERERKSRRTRMSQGDRENSWGWAREAEWWASTEFVAGETREGALAWWRREWAKDSLSPPMTGPAWPSHIISFLFFFYGVKRPSFPSLIRVKNSFCQSYLSGFHIFPSLKKFHP